ncbi:hypothetical protein PVAG01_07941 [Phlyctema vagabunda]|uniref:DUF5672 domain-containing protein n=1 Tax=Phlyctema vagabunda TaxID=108571 RepID=A0ABR4PDU4_9HELO
MSLFIGCSYSTLHIFTDFSERFSLFPYDSEESVTTSDLQTISTTVSHTKAAAIVETRRLDNLLPIILHFSALLGPEWPIHIFTSEANIDIFLNSAAFQREVSVGRFHLRALPVEVTLDSHASVSRFFTKPWLWEAMEPSEKVLLFQADSIICSGAPETADSFLEWDFIGAPIDSGRNLGVGFNGGLSIRNRALMLDIVTNHSWEQERHGDHQHGNVDYEDQWFYQKLKELPAMENGTAAARLPSEDTARAFAVETIWHPNPFGFHQANIWQPGHMDDIMNYCPEYGLSTAKTFTNHDTEG